MWKKGGIYIFIYYKEGQPANNNFTRDFISNISEPCVWRNNHLRIPFRVIHNKSSSQYPKNDLISNSQNSKLTMTILLSFTILPSVCKHRITCTENSMKNVGLIPVIKYLSEVSAIRQILNSIYLLISIIPTSKDLPTSRNCHFLICDPIFYMPNYRKRAT